MIFNYKQIFKNKEKRLKILNVMRFLPDRNMVKLQYKLVMHKRLNLKNPRTFNEKLQWLKLNDHKEIYTNLVDKYKVRDWVKENLGEEFLIPLYGAWTKFNDIDFSELPDKFVLKCNHDSGSIVVVNNKDDMDTDNLNEFFSARLENNPYTYGREWPYKNVNPMIIAEKNMSDNDGNLPIDYKFFCFNGYVDSVMICTGRGSEGKRFFFFDKNWKLRKYNKSSQELDDNFKFDKPDKIDELFKLASKLSAGFAFVRVDFYLINDQPYFGEMTLYPASGLDNNLVAWADEYLGSLIDLSVVRKS